MRVGFIGLGNMGTPIAQRIVAGGHQVTLWARRPEARQAFVGTDALFATTPSLLARSAELVGICVSDDEAVEQVLLGDDGVIGGMRPGGIVAIHSTVRPATCRRMSAIFAEKDIRVIDAPVSGGAGRAEAGQLLVMVGGEPATLHECMPVFSCFGHHIVRVGAVGAGNTAKLVNNALFLANLALVDEAITAGASLDLDPAALGDLLQYGSAQSFALGNYLRVGGLAGFEDRSVRVLRKDLGMVEALVGEGTDDTQSLLLSVAKTAAHRMASPSSEGGTGDHATRMESTTEGGVGR
jgi:3-hydroxyisobutyrate dehydrogenase